MGLEEQFLKNKYPSLGGPLQTEKEQFPPGRQSTDMSYEGNMISVEASAFWGPTKDLTGKRDPEGKSVFTYGNDELEMTSLAHLDKAFRVAYFSADITNVYVGLHHSQVFKMFPYKSMSTYNQEKICDSVEDRPQEVWDGSGTKTDSWYKNDKSDGYNPVCRPWYQRAQRNSPGSVVFNPVDFDASNGLPYIALSSGVWKGSQPLSQDQFVGVVSVDLNIAALNDTLSKTDLYKKGYAFVWDDNGMAVIHKGLKAGLKQYDIGWVDATAGGKYDLDEDWFYAQKEGMFDKGRVSGTWNYKFKGAMWYYTFMPIEGTPYMIALSVEYSEVTATADQMLSRLRGQVITATIIITVLLVVACGILAMFSVWFNKNLGTEIRHLADYVGKLKKAHYSIEMPDDPPGSSELEEIAFNMKRMVVALRFGDSKFSKGDKVKEFRNCIEALDIILELDNRRGRGVCFNNMGLCLSALHAEFRELKSNQPRGAEATVTPEYLTPTHYPNLALVMSNAGLETFSQGIIDPDVFFRRAVQEAEVSDVQNGGAGGDARTISATLATRLFNRALYLLSDTHITSEPRQQAMDCLETIAKCDDIGVLTAIAWGAASDLKGRLLTEEMRDMKDLLLRICDRARALMAEKEGGAGVEVELSHKYAELQAVQCFLDASPASQAARAWSTLSRTPRIKEQQLKAFAYWVKRSAPSLAVELDSVFDPTICDVRGLESVAPDAAVFGGAQPMAAIFLVDRTWQPILNTCINAVSMVFEDYMKSRDRFGMYGLGDGWIVPLGMKGLIDPRDIESAKVCVGTCILYTSMLDCLKVLSAAKGYSKWLVVLSDTVDLEERFSVPGKHALKSRLASHVQCCDS